MSSATLIPVSENLANSYSPDCECIDGELREQNVGEWEHAALQGIVTALFANHRKAWGVITLPEQRVQVSASNYRVADICVVESDAPRQPIVKKLPLIVTEILSRRDSLQAIRKRGNDYLKDGRRKLLGIRSSRSMGTHLHALWADRAGKW
jgi:Uma2 family endonuclease